VVPDAERRQAARPHNMPAPRFFSVPGRLAIRVGLGTIVVLVGLARRLARTCDFSSAL
jgi:hypothetical protein